jgi:Spy/CpxP family protein refolding chaperone
VLLAGVLTLSVPVLAFRGGMGGGFEGGPHHSPMQRFERMSMMLDLTDEQIAEVRPIIEQQMESNQAHPHPKKIMGELRQAISDGADQERVNQIAEAAGKGAKQRVLQKAEVMMAIRNVLTDEQKEKLEKMSEFREKRMSRLGKHH